MNSYQPGSSRFAPESLPPERMRRTQCQTCGRSLVFVTMETGGTMPCDPVQVYGDGRRHLVVRLARHGTTVGRLVPKASPETLGLEPHFGTCPCRPRKVRVAAPTLFDDVAP